MKKMKNDINEDHELVKSIEKQMTVQYCWAKSVQCNQEYCVAWDKTYNKCKWMQLIDHIIQNV